MTNGASLLREALRERREQESSGYLCPRRQISNSQLGTISE